jgi:uncharacterized tellurite resistance protein B-like protein
VTPCRLLAPFLDSPQRAPRTLVGRGRGRELPRLPEQIQNRLLLGRGRRCDVLIQRAGLGFGNVPIREPAHDDLLLASEGPGDDQRVSNLDVAVRLRALALDLDLPALARALRLRSRFEETRDIEPDIDPDTGRRRGRRVARHAMDDSRRHIHYARWVLAAILRRLGLDVDVEEGRGADALDNIADALEHMDPSEARYIAAFAYLLSRVAHADHTVSDAERRSMQRVLEDRAGLAPDRADIVTTLATSQMIHVRGTQDYLVTQEFARMASREQKRALLDGLYAVCASDASIITLEDNEIRRIASEIGLEHHDVVEIRSRYRDRLAVLQRPGVDEA